MASIITSLFQASSLLNSGKSLFAGGGASRIGDLVIDATLKEVIAYSSDITEHPIETKTAISDHIFKQPLRIKIEGYITDSPIRFMGLFETPLQNNSLSKFLNNVKSFAPFLSSDKPSKQAYGLLKAIWQQRQLISVVTKLEAFNNMAIESLEFNNDEDTGGKLEFSADLVQIVYSSVRTTANNINVNPKHVKLKEVTTPLTDHGIQEKPLESFAVQGVDAVSGFFGGVFSPENVERSSLRLR